MPGSPQTRRKPKWGTLALVALFHLIVIAGLARAFAPDFTTAVVQRATSLITVTVTVPEETPPPEPDVGASAEEGEKAKPREVSAPERTVPVKPTEVPRASSTGAENRSGARDAGQGTGGGGEGAGTGSGNSGTGQGSGQATKAVHISGAIDGSARDFPIPEGGREARVGKSVIVALTVGTNGVPTACRTYRSSGLPETDKRTCELALERLRFKPAMNARGDPVVSTFYWEQRFFR